MKDLSRIQGRLIAAGYQPVLQRLLDNEIKEAEEINFASLRTAKMVQRDLYAWMSFYSEIKAKISLRLVEATATLWIIPRGRSERRGRKHLK